jgi:hypothetical protein
MTSRRSSGSMRRSLAMWFFAPTLSGSNRAPDRRSSPLSHAPKGAGLSNVPGARIVLCAQLDSTAVSAWHKSRLRRSPLHGETRRPRRSLHLLHRYRLCLSLLVLFLNRGPESLSMWGVEVGITPGRMKRWHDRPRHTLQLSEARSRGSVASTVGRVQRFNDAIA